MAYLVESLSQFLVFIGIGVVCFFPVVSLKATGVGFGKLILSVSFFSLIAFSALQFLSPTPKENLYLIKLTFALMAVLGICYLSLSKSDKVTVVPKMGYVIFIIMSLFFLNSYNGLFSLESLFLFLSTLFVGVTIFSMLLGHYYLVVPKLSEKPLLYLHYLLWGIMALKMALSLLSYFSNSTDINLWDNVFIWMRLLWGYLAIAILTYYSYRLSKMRSTQSATGVLYVVDFFMIVGELVSYYLYNSKGLLI